MTYEIELKVRVDNPLHLKTLLDEKCEFKKAYDKLDVYYSYPGEAGSIAARAKAGERGGRVKAFRVRKDGDGCIITIKEKRIEAGIETNLEREFTTSSLELFTWFVEDLGCIERIVKKKKGYWYVLNEVNLELSFVEDLGWFLEVEKLCESGDQQEHAAAREEIQRVLAEFGIPKDRIEPRYYTDMLMEKAGKSPQVRI